MATSLFAPKYLAQRMADYSHLDLHAVAFAIDTHTIGQRTDNNENGYKQTVESLGADFLFHV